MIVHGGEAPNGQAAPLPPGVMTHLFQDSVNILLVVDIQLLPGIRNTLASRVWGGRSRG